MINQRHIFEMVENGEMTKEAALKMLIEGNTKEDIQKPSIDKIPQMFINKIHLEKSENILDESFKDLGVDVLSAIEIIKDINVIFKIDLDVSILYEYYTIRKLMNYIEQTLINSDRNFETIQKESIKEAEGIISQRGLEATIKHIVSNVLHMKPDELDSELAFNEMGVDSISGLEIVRDINKKLKTNLDAVILYDCPTVNSLVAYISKKEKENDCGKLTFLATEREEKEGLKEIYHDKYYKEMRKSYLEEKQKETQKVQKAPQIKLENLEKKKELQ